MLMALQSCDLRSSNTSISSSLLLLRKPTGTVSYSRSRCITAIRASSSREDAGATKVDRRELLAGSLAGGASLISSSAAAAPVGDPNLKTCGPANVSSRRGEIFVACCPPKPKRATIDFKPETGPLRTRLSAHLLNEDYIAKYNLAYAKMRALPADDPRSMRQQANVHCAYCNFGYRQEGDPKSKLQIHFNWLFLPWHRWYLYFHEKILGSLINDPTFAIPFFNWDNQDGGNLIPEYFLREDSALYDANRNTANYPPTLLNLSDVPGNRNTQTDPAVIRRLNLTSMSQNVATVKDPITFFGGTYRRGEGNKQSGGTLENGPHTAVHIFGGSPANPFGEDMGNFYSAGRDPLFYSHHSNVDRMWDVWRSLANADFTDEDYLNTEFLFFDENADLVRCKVKDCLDAPGKLKSVYQQMPQDKEWINYTPPSARSVAAVPSFVPVMPAAAADNYPELSAPVQVKGSPITFSVKQPNGSSSSKDEVLILEDVEVPMAFTTNFEVFLNYPSANESTLADCIEYLGSFYNIPHFMPGMQEMDTRVTDVRFSIKRNINSLKLSNASSVTVTVVPRGKDKGETFKIGAASIVYT